MRGGRGQGAADGGRRRRRGERRRGAARGARDGGGGGGGGAAATRRTFLSEFTAFIASIDARIVYAWMRSSSRTNHQVFDSILGPRPLIRFTDSWKDAFSRATSVA